MNFHGEKNPSYSLLKNSLVMIYKSISKGYIQQKISWCTGTGHKTGVVVAGLWSCLTSLCFPIGQECQEIEGQEDTISYIVTGDYKIEMTNPLRKSPHLI